jgi:hypothetical protein
MSSLRCAVEWTARRQCPEATDEARQWPDLARYQGSPYVTGAGLED